MLVKELPQVTGGSQGDTKISCPYDTATSTETADTRGRKSVWLELVFIS